MASKTSTSLGVGITVTLLGVLSLGLFVAAIIFFSQSQSLRRQLTQAQADTSEILRAEERNSDAVLRLKDEAKRDNKSAMGYLVESMRSLNLKISGSGSDTPKQLLEKLDGLAPTGSVADAVAGLRNEIQAAGTKLAEAESARNAALDQAKQESERTGALAESFKQTVAKQNAELEKNRAELDSYRQGVNKKKEDYDAALDKVRGEAQAREAQLNERIKKLEAESLTLIDRLNQLQAAKSKDQLKPGSEAALVDGSVIAIDSSAGTITINRGARDKVFLGITFAVYADATAIKPDEKTGEYPRGKATVEVISVGDSSSVCRITSEVRGNPIVRGDVVANSLYDPKKVYTFLVYGNFDVNSDGRPTAAEADQIRAIVKDWGGTTVDELTGNVDFLILGARPTVPPRPAPGAPLAVVQEFIRLDTAAQRYDTLFSQATATSIPVLNENRLYTLIGKPR